MPPDHTIQVDIDESRAQLTNYPLPVKVTGLRPNTTNVNMVSLPPVTIPDFGNIVTVDARVNYTAPDIRFQLPDQEVVRVTLPDPPPIGRDISIKLPSEGRVFCVCVLCFCASGAGAAGAPGSGPWGRRGRPRPPGGLSARGGARGRVRVGSGSALLRRVAAPAVGFAARRPVAAQGPTHSLKAPP
jgi:hypothetical protein